MHKAHDAFKSLVEEYSHISIITHINPDADTIGTALGVAGVLKKYGKKVEVVNVSKELPKRVDFLEGYAKIKPKIGYKDSLLIACDCGDIGQLGLDVEGKVLVNIDHHVSNSNFGTLNIVNPTAVSASQTVFELFRGSSDFVMDKQSATALYTALLSDTKNFTTNNVTQESFEVVNGLLEYGVEHTEVSQNLNRRNSLASLRITALALSSFALHLNAQVGVIVVRQEDIETSGATLMDMQELSHYSDSLATTVMGVMIVELEEVYKVSLRSKHSCYDVSKIAMSLGGGGHKSAAGCKVSKTRYTQEELLEELLKKLEPLLEGEKI